MDWRVVTGEVTDTGADAILVPIREGPQLKAAGLRLDALMDGHLTALLAAIRCSGAAGSCRTLPTLGRGPARFVTLAGHGGQPPSVTSLRQVGAAATKATAEAGAGSLAVLLPENLEAAAAAGAFAEGALLGGYRYRRYKTTTPADETTLTSITLVAPAASVAAVEQAIERAAVLVDGMNLARDLVNQPGADLWPARLAQHAAAMAAGLGIACRVYGGEELATMGAGALLGVGRGSDRPPHLVHLCYRPGAADAPPAVTLIGKGITFDTGGYSLKSHAGMETMKGDMAGAAAVLGALQVIGRRRPNVAVDAVIVTAENMVSGRAMRPGDVLTSLSGKTIEVNNTDAEGRLVLADAITFALRHGATEMIDLATLTGACVVALGTVCSGLMGNDQPLIDRLLLAGQAVGEPAWQLPLWPEYGDTLKSSVADLRNSGGRSAGAQVGAMFLKSFVGSTPWAHFDIAGTALQEKPTALSPKGATGVGVRTLVHYVESRAAG